jgi:hypothetical protein
MSSITIDNQKYKVVENLGYSQSRGIYAKIVLRKGKEVVVTKQRRGLWRFDNPVNKLKPKSRYIGQ